MGEEVRGTRSALGIVHCWLLIAAVYRKQKRSTANPRQTWTNLWPTWRVSELLPCHAFPSLDIHIITNNASQSYNHTALLAFCGLVRSLFTVSSLGIKIVLDYRDL